MKRAIAKIRLAPGNAGWFDPLTNIYLTLSKKECFVYNDQDVSNIRKAIKQNKLVLKEGRLPSPVSEDDKKVVKPVKKHAKPKEDKVIEEVEVIEEKEINNTKVERPKKKTKRKPEESKLQKQEEEVKQEVVKQEGTAENPLMKVAELIKEEKAEEDKNNG